jgi:hypothetical protein
MAHRTLSGVHRTMSGAPGQQPTNQPLSGIFSVRSTIIHRTIQCATGLSGEPAEQRLPTRRRSIAQMNSATTKVRVQKWEVTGLSGVTPDCPMQKKYKRLQRSTTPNPNGRINVARTGQWTVPVRCATGLSGAPFASRLCQRLGSDWGYKYPQPPHSKPSKYSEIFIHCKSKVQHSKTQSKQSIHSKFPKSTLVLKGLWEDHLCSFVALVAWIAFFLSHSNS